jgi:transposase-like protein
MRVPQCPKCGQEGRPGTNFKLKGKFYRRSDSTLVQRYCCLDCRKGFSAATFQPCYRQKKRHKNLLLRRLLCSGVSQRRCAKILFLNRKTVVKKFLFLAIDAEFFLRKFNLSWPRAHTVEFDDLETIEHTKLKLPAARPRGINRASRELFPLEKAQLAHP